MKSIIEEASSIIKAIEKGWASAGKPSEFTVKILEQPAYNFLGFNTKPAKISFFFDDRTITAAIEKQTRGEFRKPEQTKTHRRDNEQTRHQPSKQNDYAKPTRRDSEQQPRLRHERQTGQVEAQEQRSSQQKKSERIQQQSPNAVRQDTHKKEAKERAPLAQRQNVEGQAAWSPETLNLAKEWVQQFLATIQKGHISFTANTQNHILKIDFSGLITGNNQKEIMLFKNAAHLLMSSLRNVTNSELKQLKVVFSTAQG